MDWIWDLIRVDETAEATGLAESWFLAAASLGVLIGVIAVILLFRRKAAANTPAERLVRLNTILLWGAGTSAVSVVISGICWFALFAGSYLVRSIGVVPGVIAAGLACVLPLLFCSPLLRRAS